MSKGPSLIGMTMKVMQQSGWTCTKVEHWNSFAHIRQDLFGFGDVLAFNDECVSIIQVTSTSNMSSREKKILANPIARQWADSEFRRIYVMGWKKYTERKDGRSWRPTTRLIAF